MAQTIEVQVPDIGDFEDVEVIELLVKPGDRIEIEQSLITVESDKASMEIPSEAAGIVQELRVKVGDRVRKGSVVVTLQAGDAAAAAAASSTAAAPAPAPAPAAAPALAPAPGPAPAAAQPQASTAPVPAPAPSAAGAAPAAGTGGELEIDVPDIGDFAEVEVIELLVKPGDMVEVEQGLVTVESDKASMEIPSAAAGRVKSLLVKVGDRVSKGSPLAVLESAGSGGQPAAAAPAPAPQSASASAPGPAPAPAPASMQYAAPDPSAPVADPAVARASTGAGGSVAPSTSAGGNGAPAAPAAAVAGDDAHVVKPHASPSVRKFARELGVDLSRVRGSGPRQRVTHDDVRAYVKGAVASAMAPAQAAPAAAAVPSDAGASLGLAAWPKVDFAKFGPVERQARARIKKLSAANLHRNWVMIPHVTNHEDADITSLEAFRVQINRELEKSGTKVTMLAFLVKACVAALQKFPEFNASLDGDELVLKRYYHIGFAADTPNGLMVPVIRDADRKGVVEIARETAELAKKARDGKLSPGEMQGGTFSISSLGGIGGTYFTPIINAPEVAILGVCRSVMRPTWDESTGSFVPRLILPLSLSWDHRVVDGAAAARFNSMLAQLLADFRRAMI